MDVGSPSPPDAPQVTSPRDPVEVALVLAWEKAFGVPVAVDADFRALGGDKPTAVAIGRELKARLGVWLPPSAFKDFPRLEQLAAVYRPLVPRDYFGTPTAMNRAAAEATDGAGDIFFIHGVGGEVVSVQPLATRLGENRRAWGLEVPSLRAGDRDELGIRALAARHVATIRAHCDPGPIALAGHSLGGLIAFEMARQLNDSEFEVELLALLDSEMSEQPGRRPPAYGTEERERLLEKMCRARYFPPGSTVDLLDRFIGITKGIFDAASAYEIRPFDVPAVLFQTNPYGRDAGVNLAWTAAIASLRTETIGGDHYTMYMPPNVGDLARRMDEYLGERNPIGLVPAARRV